MRPSPHCGGLLPSSSSSRILGQISAAGIMGEPSEAVLSHVMRAGEQGSNVELYHRSKAEAISDC